MKLEDLGYNDQLEAFRVEHHLESFELGRIVTEHKERYIVRTAEGELEAEITGHMRFTAQSREDFPAVGDWVALTAYGADFGVIHQLLPRYSLLKRPAVGQFGEVQIIAANIDSAFLLQAVDRDFSINRLERYLTLCHSSGIRPLIVLTKTDLIDEARVQEISAGIKARANDVPLIALSNETRSGYETLQSFIEKGKTYCMLGSSGVGKSTLMNNLSGRTQMKTGSISQNTNRGKHVTSQRELIILENGGILIDNPGMREVGVADSGHGLEMTFDRILTLAQGCKFKDCTHTREVGCAVLEAIEAGELEQAAYDNYLKMEREKAHFESTVAERRKKEKKFGKIYKDIMKDHKKKH